MVLIALLQRRFFYVRQLAFPLYVAAAAAALGVFRLLDPGTAAFQKNLELAQTWILIFLAFAFLLRLLGIFFFDVHWSARHGTRLPPLVPAAVMALAYLTTAFVTLKVIFPAVDFRPLLATSAVTSLVLGLALQPILANFFTGLVISVEKPFRINDWIRVGEHEGRVVAITWRTTHLRTRENDNLVLPNSKIADERVLNFYYPHPLHMERIQVGVDLEAPPYRVRRALLEAVTGVQGALDKPTPDVNLVSFGESAANYELRVWIDDMAQGPRIASDLRMRIWEELHKEGMTLPYPVRRIELPPRQTRAERTSEIALRRARLYVADGPERGRTFDLDGQPVTAGRSRACAIALTDPNASKEHLRLEWSDGGYVVTDLGSSFGTRINGQTISSPTRLRPLDRIAIGDTVMVFEGPRHGRA
ncbi:MAG TPA: mechanosensitive ion channel domain-containing protein [Thermoanaerobaculia bacterium]|nr:mechanosensitive ion channel domain-containing protein [Thermoanaerobaculia bacterium]